MQQVNQMSKRELWFRLSEDIHFYKTTADKLFLYRARLYYCQYKRIGGKKTNNFIENSYKRIIENKG